MAKISGELKMKLDTASHSVQKVLDMWRELDIDDFHGLRIVQEELQKIQRELEARK